MGCAAAVQIVDLSRRFGAVTAIDGLSLTVETGSLLALLGPNGAGKTTTVEICEGFQRPDGGTVRVLGARSGSAIRPHSGRGSGSCSSRAGHTAPPGRRRCCS